MRAPFLAQAFSSAFPSGDPAAVRRVPSAHPAAIGGDRSGAPAVACTLALGRGPRAACRISRAVVSLALLRVRRLQWASWCQARMAVVSVATSGLVMMPA